MILELTTLGFKQILYKITKILMKSAFIFLVVEQQEPEVLVSIVELKAVEAMVKVFSEEVLIFFETPKLLKF